MLLSPIRMHDKFLKPYNPADTEKRIYELWEKSGFFNPDNLEKLAKEGGKAHSQRHLKPFTIVMPPPNANGKLHVGHALAITLEDIMTRYKRMRGYKALWIPGADHAGFETQIVYEKKLEKEGRSRFKMDPQELYKEIMAFTLENKSSMEAAVRSIGASCDWSREKFTLDGDVIATVHRTFKKMYDDGLIYRGNRLVNWCTKHQTSLSDVETESKETTDTLYYMTYGPLSVATVRPETMFGDVAVAVNPDDARYKKYIGKDITVTTPIGTMTLKVVGDAMVDAAFGTGALKITPAHDKNDFELAQRHKLPLVEVIDQFGKLNEKTGKYKGLKVLEARKQVVADLKALGLVSKEEPYKHVVPVCYKCETTIEPRLIPQWFVKMKPLAEKALAAVEAGKVVFMPDNYRKIFTYWMNNTLDWNISRQIVWGISIPAKLCTTCDFGAPDLEGTLTTCPQCKSPLRADTDTFDTWFSSGQWPLVTLGYNGDPKTSGADFKTFYPTDVMETGSDLIFKWIPRMVIFGLYLAGDVPFRTVYLHGLVNDAHGKKMSKSKGNVVNPLSLTEKYGTDALRIGLIVGNTPGTDLALAESKIKGYKNFANKLWNITRFILSTSEGIVYDPHFSHFTEKDKGLLADLDTLLVEITREMDELKLYIVAEKLYHYSWHTLADVILEESKPLLLDEGIDPAIRLSRQQLLRAILHKTLAALHPFMPFVTEEIWQTMHEKAPAQGQAPLLMVASWPVLQ
jgi:valyl-tRNA synthetase